MLGTADAAAIYDPGTGRFLQRDPSGYPDGMNAYAGYHAMRGGVDPSGLSTQDVPIMLPVGPDPHNPNWGYDISRDKRYKHEGRNVLNRARFAMVVKPAECTINVSVSAKMIERKDLKERFPNRMKKLMPIWESAIERTWSNQAVVLCPCDDYCPQGYLIKVDFRYVDNNAHYDIDVKIGRTRSVTVWGIGDTQGHSAAHEFGHMIGNHDEYGIVEFGPDDRRWYGRGSETAPGGVMGAVDGLGPKLVHYSLIRDRFIEHGGRENDNCFLSRARDR